MQEYVKFTAAKDKGVQLQKKTYKVYGCFKAGLVLTLAAAGGLVFDIANMVDWILYGCSAMNILVHALAAVALGCMLYGSVVFMRGGGRKHLLRPAEVVRIYNDHIYIHYIPYKKKKDHVHLNIYYCDIRTMEYHPSKRCLCIDSPAQIRVISEKKGEKVTGSSEPEKGIYYIYDWFEGFRDMMNLIEDKSLRKIGGWTR